MHCHDAGGRYRAVRRRLDIQDRRSEWLRGTAGNDLSHNHDEHDVMAEVAMLNPPSPRLGEWLVRETAARGMELVRDGKYSYYHLAQLRSSCRDVAICSP